MNTEPLEKGCTHMNERSRPCDVAGGVSFDPDQGADQLFDRLVQLGRASQRGEDVSSEIEAIVGRLVALEKAHPEYGVRTTIHPHAVAA